MKLDILQLSEKNHSKSSICAVMNDPLRNQISNALKKIKKRKIKLNNIAKNAGMDYTTFWKHLKRKESVPLSIIRELQN